MNKIFQIKPMYNNEFINALNMNEQPPTLYSLMESKVNYGRDEKVKIEELPTYFRTYLFDFSYPIPANLKEEFEELFLTKYMFRRINFDTYLSFKLHLKTKLKTIMPKYNLMLDEFNKLNFDGNKETITRNRNDEKNTNATINTESETNNISQNKYSDTPQDDLTSVQDGTYLTDYTYNTNDGTNESSSTNVGKETNEEEETTVRITGDNIDEYIKFNENIQNIYEEIFTKLDTLFYGLA